MRGGRRHLGAFAVAFIALALFGFASVQSLVMQTEMAAAGSPAPPQAENAASAMSGMPDGDMAGMSMPAAPASLAAKAPRAPAHRDSSSKSCPYCAATAHAPIVGVSFVFQAPTAATFTAYRAVPSLGPRGPPAVRPRARAPPHALRSVLNRGPANPARPIFT